MEDFKIGDIVKPKTIEDTAYYVVTGLEDNSRKDKDGNMIKSVIYEVAKIYPVSKKSDIEYFRQDALSIIAQYAEKENKMIIDFVLKERANNDWHEIPDFVKCIDMMLGRTKSKVKTTKKKKVDLTFKSNQDIDDVNYEKLLTFDDCLDALNDLDDLYENFKDEDYLKSKETVNERLLYLTKFYS